MAHSHTALTAAQTANAAADKPLAIGLNRLRASSVSAKWRSDGDGSAADESATGTSTAYLWDGYSGLLSAPNAAATTWYLCFDLAAEVTFDSLWIHGTVLPTTLTATVANNNTFADTPSDIVPATAVTASAKRWSCLMLDHAATAAQVYTARYLRLKMEWAGATTPQISEVFVGTRRQLGYNADEPFDPANLGGSVTDRKTETGITTRYVHYRGQRHLSANLRAWADPLRSDLESFFSTDLQHGTLPFVWIDKPNSAPNAAYLMLLDDPALAYPYVGPQEREWSLIASEQGPYFRALEV